jgi:4-amino-4-deoxy-L-arabinose transferase-like glycosyltransferase
MVNSCSFTTCANPQLNKVYLHRGKEVTLVDPTVLHEYLAQGWQYGKTDSKRCYVNKDGKYLYIDRDKLSEYLEEGWKYGATGKPRTIKKKQ